MDNHAEKVDAHEHRDITRTQLEAMRTAGQRVRECESVLRRSNTTVVGELIKSAADFYQWDHYPDGDVYDQESHSQYYYHAHPPEKRGNEWGEEHGHFHTFLRPKGFPKNIEPADIPGFVQCKGENEALSHLIAISMDYSGKPIRLFTTNRWVTGEIWYAADDVKKMRQNFAISHATPSWPANLWLTNILILFGPLIDDLIDARDKAIAAHAVRVGSDAVYDDRALEITSIADINVDEQIAMIEARIG